MPHLRNWAIWLSSVAFLLMAGAGRSPAQSKTVETRTSARIQVDQLPPPLRKKVTQVLDQPTIFSHGPAEVFAGQPGLYQWLLDHPDQGVLAWRRLGAKCTEIKDKGNGQFEWSDGRGSSIRWQTIHDDPALRVWYAEGDVRPGLFLPNMPFKAVLLLRHGSRHEGTERPLVYHQADVFLKSDSKTATLIARMLGDKAPRLVEEGLGQLELFFSGLVWYCNQHPERIERLLDKAPASQVHGP
jgi:hypothetical protein